MARHLMTFVLLTFVPLTGCIPSKASGGETSASPTTTSSTAVSTTPTSAAPVVTTTPSTAATTTLVPTTSVAETSEAQINTSTTVSAAGASTAGEAVELAQFGLRFRTPASFQVADRPDVDFHATSTEPEGYLTVLACDGCERELMANAGDQLRLDAIDGVQVQIIVDAQLELPDGVTANALVVNDAERSFSAVMSSTGDLKAPWNEFVDSIEFIPVDPDAPSDLPPNPSTDRTVVLDLFLASFTLPEGFETIPETPANLDGFAAGRPSPARAVLFIDFCGACSAATLPDLGGTVTELRINGIPAQMITGAKSPDGSDAIVNTLFVYNATRAFAVVMVGDDIDNAWTELVDSLTVRGVGV